MIIAQIVVITFFGILLLARAVNLIVLMRWYARPKPPGSTTFAEGKRFYYTLKGEGDPTVVIEAGLGTASPEWWAIQDELAKTTRILTYDRGGYGWSEYVVGPRTSRQIAVELKGLLDTLEIDAPIILIGHSQGGLYVNHFCRLFPDAVAGVVLLDPMSPDDTRFRQELIPRIYERSGVDKSRLLKLQSWLSGFGFTRLMRRTAMKSPPFSQYRSLPKETVDILWHHQLLPKTPQTALNEYAQAHDPRNNVELRNPNSFPPVPLRVLTHSSDTMRESIVRNGGLTRDEASRVEDLWQELIRSSCNLSQRSKLILADHAGHAIHLEQPDLVLSAVREVLEEVRRLPDVAG